MNTRNRIAMCVSSGVIMLVAGMGVAVAVPFPARTLDVSHHQSTDADPRANRDGWQSPQVYAVPTGTGGLFYHYSCPAGRPVAQNGSFEFDGDVGQLDTVSLTYNGPRYDESTPDYSTWGWFFRWPSNSKAGETITFNVQCEKKGAA